MSWNHLPEWDAIAQIFFVNVALSGDNAVVIALAAHRLPPRQRRMAVLGGGLLAMGLRVVFTLLATSLLRIPGLMLAGGAFLFYVACKLIAHDESGPAQSASSQNALAAVRIIVYADLAMSLDNVLAVAGASGGNRRQMIIGLLISVVFMLFCSSLICALMNRFRWLVSVGAAVLAFTASEMFFGSVSPGWHAVAIVGCLGVGYRWKRFSARGCDVSP